LPDARALAAGGVAARAGKECRCPNPVVCPWKRIEQAAGIIDPVFLYSPQFRAELEQQFGCRLVVKARP
jgi:hypothetical protein